MHRGILGNRWKEIVESWKVGWEAGRKMTNSWGRTFYFWETQQAQKDINHTEEAEGKGTFWVGNEVSRQVPVTKGPLCEMQVARVREGEV